MSIQHLPNGESDKVSELTQVEKLKRMWKMTFLVAILVTIVLIAFTALVVYATNVKVQTWGFTKEYEEGFEFIIQWTPSKFSVTLELAIGNPSAFTVTVRDMIVRLTINGINVGSLGSQEEWCMIPAFDWRMFTITFSVTGDDADALQSASTHNIYVSLRGEASCMFYKTLFETTYQKSYG